MFWFLSKKAGSWLSQTTVSGPAAVSAAGRGGPNGLEVHGDDDDDSDDQGQLAAASGCPVAAEGPAVCDDGAVSDFWPA